MKKIIKNYWSNRASSYSQMIKEDMNTFKKDAWTNIIKNKLGKKNNARVLDIGTGPGFFAIIIAKMGHDVTAVDCSDMMLKEARSNAKVAGVNINFIKSDVENLQLVEESFDLIINRNVVWTLKEPLKAYENWFNLLNENGKLVVFDANWYLRLSKLDLQTQYKKDMTMAIHKGYDSGAEENQSKECESIARKLPLTYEARPIWDKQALSKCGFKEIIIEDDISDKVYTEEEKLAYKTTPMFSIVASKKCY